MRALAYFWVIDRPGRKVAEYTMRQAIFALLLTTTAASATDNCSEDAMIVFDGSGSMAETGFNLIEEPRIFEARRAVAEAVPEIAANRRLGLVIYGPGGVDECTGLDLRFPPTQNAADQIISDVNALQPEGSTALTEAVDMAAETLDYQTKPGAIVLVTDGKETCGGAPCQLAAQLHADAKDLTIHVIGYKVRGDYFAWTDDKVSDYLDGNAVSACMAETTGGTYVNAETVDELVQALRETLGCKFLF